MFPPLLYSLLLTVLLSLTSRPHHLYYSPSLISFSLSLISFSLLSSLSFFLSLFSLSKASFKWSDKVLQKLQQQVYSKILERLHGSNVDADSVTDAEDGVERLMAELLRQKSQVSRTYPGKVLQVSDGRLHASFNLAPFYLCWISFPRTASFTCFGESGRCIDKNGTMSALGRPH